ncbi:DUF1684 domain-containing protein [Flammeovirga pacifica]|uniref:DUF1684 domain-containing protein n=1 Tax=Flammeovirga pacifica TaxID=915059 RepID=A0A1S1YT52_FLAPC|nr:DUF1684 domain-containing protein [Flammeovirga pacifica]OHX64199.1 hypothetical protein NH26_21585 [Flammeovirga pacifica]
MKLNFTIIVTLLSLHFCIAQNYTDEIQKYQVHLTEEYKDPKTSPLKGEMLKEFKGHEYFPIDKKYSVKAKFKRVKGKPFGMKTSSTKLKTYETYGIATFKIDGKKYKLSIYQSHRLRTMPEYKDYLFLPFMDQTNGTTSYGAGRYLDLRIPEDGKTIVIDFNKAYNPYCAYSDGYSCPIPPSENYLDTKIEAGIKNPKHEH